MKSSCLLISCVGVLFGLSGCVVGHQDYINFRNSTIGKKKIEKKLHKWTDSGELIRGDFLIAGDGLTRISEDKDGNLVYHYSVQVVLPNYTRKEWVGKCLLYEIVDPNTYIIKGWGFDEGGNPLSCRSWP